MTPRASRILCLFALALSVGCGAAPSEGAAPSASDSSGKTWNPRLNEFDLTGVVEPGAGRFQLIAAPQAALQTIPEDANGSATTVGAGNIQVYGATVSFPALGNATYPAACNIGAPQAMISNVEVRSGFTEQLRNVYARIDSIFGGGSFCSMDPVGTFATELGSSYKGLYRYEPLNPASGTNTTLFRTKQWALNLPNSGTFWFGGKLLAEVIPLPPTGTTPANYPATGSIVHTGGTTTVSTTFRWTYDPLANGLNPEGFTVARPTSNGVRMEIMRCNPITQAYNSGQCTTTVSGLRNRTGTTLTRTVTAGYWHRWTLISRFTLPPNGTQGTGTLANIQTFQVVNP